MKHSILIAWSAALLVASQVVFAQDRIYRCGDEYTNSPSQSQKSNCKLVTGGNVTVVKSQTFVALPRSSNAPAGSQRVAPNEQRGRDLDARQILESELRKVLQRRDEVSREYNNGEGEKMGSEGRNHQKYLDRMANLKADLDRSDTDISGLQRELDRNGNASGPK